MSAMTGDPRFNPRNRQPGQMAEPPLRRTAAPAGQHWPQVHPDTRPAAPAGPSISASHGHWQADPAATSAPSQAVMRSASPASAPGAGASQYPGFAGQGRASVQPVAPRAHAFAPPAAPGTPEPDPLLDSQPAIPSAVYSWPEERARPAAVSTAAPSHSPAHSPAQSAPPALASAQQPAKPANQPTRPAARRVRRDPSPSRLSYRLHRLWLTPLIRRGITLGLPLFLMTLTIGLWLGDDARRAQVTDFFSELRTGFENRPEFQVTTLSVNAETPEVARAISLRLGLEFPVSSFRLDLEELRRATEALDAVETAALRIRSGGVLEVSVIEREPVMVWRHHAGLELVDGEGRRIARLAEREARADLPLIAGEGAPAAIAEAQQLLAAASPLRARMRGLVRISERRWDVVLDRGQRIMLPADGAVVALERVLALDGAQDLLARDVSVVDLRDASRPTIRLSQPAMVELHRIRNQASGVPNR
ncbi:cell division protein FtsQ/DivIB [Pararhodobacter sp.]|uniref:cell division protein FtsQ/DivIB n=1 Tax=Pararhodobacter sp. TaxID=2127056 RepID=UPI002FDDF400